VTAADSRRAVEAAARHSYGKLVAYLAARTGDVAGAEDSLSEAFAAALVAWPADGVPRAPEAWLLAVARRKAIDQARRRRTHHDSGEMLAMLAEEMTADSDIETAIPDDRLRLMFACAHPAIEEAARAPLILQTVLGLDAAAIASAFLVAPATMSQRLVRAKRKIAATKIPFRVPERDDLAERLDTVLDAIYAVFAAGWADPAGAVARTRDFAEEAIWLGRLVVSLQPEAAEALGLLALMLHAEARRAARRDAGGDFVPLDEQDVARWDGATIDEAEELLLRASAIGAVGRFQLEAAVQSAHAVRRRTGRADWAAILQL
jgi:RNA polymerase sigma-70 factor (ECF subfamily)